MMQVSIFIIVNDIPCIHTVLGMCYAKVNLIQSFQFPGSPLWLQRQVCIVQHTADLYIFAQVSIQLHMETAAKIRSAHWRHIELTIDTAR